MLLIIKTKLSIVKKLVWIHSVVKIIFYWLASSKYVFGTQLKLSSKYLSTKQNDYTTCIKQNTWNSSLVRWQMTGMSHISRDVNRTYKRESINIYIWDVRPPTKTDRASILVLSRVAFVFLTGALVCYHRTIKCIGIAASRWVGVLLVSWIRPAFLLSTVFDLSRRFD